jgi:hypothetical protein
MIRISTMLKAGVAALPVAVCAMLIYTPPSRADTAIHQAPSSPQAEAVVLRLLDANRYSNAVHLYDVLAPSLFDDPWLAGLVVRFAQNHPHQIRKVAEVLARIEIALAKADQEKAGAIEAIIKSAPPALQYAYAEVLEKEANRVDNATKGIDADSLKAVHRFYIPAGAGTSTGFGGGLVSPN